MNKTVIQVTFETRDKLVSVGKKNETYDDIINRLIATYNNEEGKKLKK